MSANRSNKRDLRTLPQAVEARPFLTIRWLRNLVYERRLPSYRIGGKVLVDLNELDAFVEASRRDDTPSTKTDAHTVKQAS